MRQMLSERRGLINPASMGIVRGDPRGRKSPGLSQAHMDQLTHRSPGTYGRLERGFLENPSPEYLHAIARILRLSEQEWEVLCGYARGERPPFPLAKDPGVPQVWADVVSSLSSMAYLCDYAGNILAYNAPFTRLFPGRRVPVNSLWWMVFSDDARNTVLMDWENSWAPVLVPQIRAAAARYKSDPTLLQLKDRCLADPRTRDLYRGVPNGHAHPDGDEKPLYHTESGPGWVHTCVSVPLSSPEVRLFVLQFRKNGQPRPGRPRLRNADVDDITAFFPDRGDEAGSGRLLASTGRR
ncbi:helix-turn-helix domain-containing protein [Streptomyces cinnamoneus]|uniref:helix-turn-helix domain-containing protein n=1 Tax=Streptomyces cinnamoneus TaxID=53446 RepID=UPI0037A26949